jgi:hypothetical protein
MELAVIAAAVSITVGWHASKVVGTHRAIPVRRRELRDQRRTRMSRGTKTLWIAALLALVLAVAIVR